MSFTKAIITFGICSVMVMSVFSQEDDGCVCTMEYSPVCGKNGVTYSNSCQLDCAACDNECIDQIHPGRCEDGCPCPAIEDPVCASNGQTYSNECVMNCTIASEQLDPCISVVYYGECTDGSAPVQEE